MLTRRAFLAVAVAGIVGGGATVATERLKQGNRLLAHGATAPTPEPLSGFDPYLHRETGALADPINVIFRGDVPVATALLNQVLGWYTVDGSAMNFVDEAGTHPTAMQMGFNLANQSRYHIRLGSVIQREGHSYVLAGVHRDDMTHCGHIGVSFDQMRELVAGGFARAGYTVTSLRLNNTSAGPQCDGSWTAGDGTAAIIDLTRQVEAR